jgi:hypothetical protein
MHSTLKLRDSDPHDDFSIAPDVVPAAWADKVLADITRDAGSEAESPPDVRDSSDRQASVASGVAVAAPAVDTTFRATATDDSVAPIEQPSTSRWAKSAIMLVFAIGSAAAAAAWQNHGDAARQMISNWVPAFAALRARRKRRSGSDRYARHQIAVAEQNALRRRQLAPPGKRCGRPPRPLRTRRSCNQWHAILRRWRSRLSSSRPASPNSRRASKRCSATPPERPITSLQR